MCSLISLTNHNVKEYFPLTHSLLFTGSKVARIVKIALTILTLAIPLIFTLLLDVIIAIKGDVVAVPIEPAPTMINSVWPVRLIKAKDSILKCTYQSFKIVKWSCSMLPQKIRWLIVTSLALQVINKTVGMQRFTKEFLTYLGPTIRVFNNYITFPFLSLFFKFARNIFWQTEDN